MTGSPQPHLEAELERTAGVRFADHSARLTNPNEDDLANAIALVAEDHWASNGGERASVGDLVAETREVLDHDDLRRLVADGLMRPDTADAYARVLEADAGAFTPELEAQATGVIDDMGLTPYDAAAVAELRDTSAAQAAELQDLAAEQGRSGPTEAELAADLEVLDREERRAFYLDLSRQQGRTVEADSRRYLEQLDQDDTADVGAVLADDRAIDAAAARCEWARNDERADLAVAVAEAAVAAAEAGERARERAAAAGESARSAGERATGDADEWA